MNKTSPGAPKNSPTLQKALFICILLIFCVLVYIFVSLQSSREPASVTILTPPPGTAAPDVTQAIQHGMRENVFLEYLRAAPVILGAYNEKTRRCSIELPPDSNKDTPCAGDLELITRDGYVQGIRLEMAALTPPVKGKDMDAYEQSLYAAALLKYNMELDGQRLLIHTVLSESLALLDTDAGVASSMVLIWEAGAESLLEDGATYTGESGSFVFAAARSRTGRLILSLGR